MSEANILRLTKLVDFIFMCLGVAFIILVVYTLHKTECYLYRRCVMYKTFNPNWKQNWEKPNLIESIKIKARSITGEIVKQYVDYCNYTVSENDVKGFLMTCYGATEDDLEFESIIIEIDGIKVGVWFDKYTTDNPIVNINFVNNRDWIICSYAFNLSNYSYQEVSL